MSTQDVYRALAAGEPEAVQRFAPRVASIAAEARRKRLAVSVPARAPAIAAPAPEASTPPPRKLSRRDRGNAMAAQMGGPASQQGIDDMHAGIVAKLNATPPSRQGPDEGRRASPGPKQSQGEIDDMWASLVADGNKQAGLRTRSRPR
jgi:hypothetical protein